MFSQLKLKRLEFGSLFSYVPKKNFISEMPEEAKIALNFMTYLKQDKIVSVRMKDLTKDMPVSDYVALALRNKIDSLPFKDFFASKPVLIPVPRSSPLTKDALWVPNNIANAMVEMGLGSKVISCLSRTSSVNRSAQSTPSKRPLPMDHYNSVSVNKTLTPLQNVLLVDDIVTRGSTLMGMANRLLDDYSSVEIRAFAAIRTISNPAEFKNRLDPVKGYITLRVFSDTIRRP